MDKTVTIDFWGDITCPFCYIAENLLLKVLGDLSCRDRVQVNWHSYILHNDWELHETVTWHELMDKITEDDVRKMYRKKESILSNLSNQYGIVLNLAESISHNSINAARLLKFASTKGVALELANAFSYAVFAESLDLSVRDNLQQKAVEVGLSIDDVTSVLNDEERYRKEVSDDQILAEKYAYNYIPTIYFNRENILEGVIDYDMLSNILSKLC